METEYTHGLMEDHIPVIMLLMLKREMESIFGQMEKHIKDNGLKGFSMGKVSILIPKANLEKEFGRKVKDQIGLDLLLKKMQIDLNINI